MIALSRQLTERTMASTDSLYCNATDDGKSVMASSVLSTTSSASSTKSGSTSKSSKSRSTTKSSKSSTPSIPATPNFKRTIDPLSMSTKAIHPGFMPNFNTHLFAPGFQIPEASLNKTGGPKAYQSKQLTFVDKKSKSASGSSAKSTKSSRTASSDKSIKSSASSTKSTIFSSLSATSGNNGGSSSSTHNSSNKASSSASKVPPLPGKGNDTASSHTSASTKTPTSTITVTSPTNESSPVEEADESIAETIDKLSRTTAGLTRTEQRGHLSPHQQPRRHSMQSSSSELLAKRICTWEYLAKVHSGQSAFYNTIVLTEADLRAYYSSDALYKRAFQFFSLGTSLANILDISDIPTYTRSLSSVLQEYEHFLSSESKSKMNFFKGAGRKLGDEETGEYAHFEVKSVPFEMDYVVTFATLCEMIALAYKRFGSGDSYHAMVDTDLFAKIDTRLKKLSLMCTKELEQMVHHAMEDEFIFLDPLGSARGEWAQSILAIGH
ncbi:hypothetical protein BGZ94_000924 [Podila epigama]|nr:hypothetical protein BGZ94_000924 [Podila epigama]